jgi:hypothetical protein
MISLWTVTYALWGVGAHWPALAMGLTGGKYPCTTMFVWKGALADYLFKRGKLWISGG